MWLARQLVLGIILVTVAPVIMAQTVLLGGKVSANGAPVALASVALKGAGVTVLTDSAGNFMLGGISPGAYEVYVTATGYQRMVLPVVLANGQNAPLTVQLVASDNTLTDVVITGTMKAVMRAESPVNVEVYTPNFFRKNPTPNIYDALQNVNGVRPQLNCNVCNTGDIRINGLAGPYTMVLIDGMPIVSSLSTVYGLSGIPNAMVERIEIVKGPASSLYGSEAVGGLINIITKKVQNAPVFSADVFATSWAEFNADIGFKMQLGKNIDVLTGINYFNFQNKVDNNGDNFTDMTLQNRISVFQKINIRRKDNRLFSIAGRYMYEDRWGGDLRWNKAFRGGDSIYGESIYTKRWELLGNYQLPTREKLMLSFSYNDHQQNSVYGNVLYVAQQKIGFTQLTWDKKIGRHDLLAGTALRYTFYDDNTPGTATGGATSNPKNAPQNIWLPGIFLQDEVTLTSKQKLLLGMRYDYNSVHGNIFTPRVAYKWTINRNNILRVNAGTGFRVVNLFTEDHAALTGARIVDIKNTLNPEQSYNLNINYVKKLYGSGGMFINLDASAFYTYFNNRIVGDFETDPNRIIYDNLDGFAENMGATANLDMTFKNGLKVLVGATFMENTLTENGMTTQQILTEKVSGNWAVSYKLKRANLSVDYTGNLYGPMRLPLLSALDPRSAYSPWWSIQNIQLTYDGFKHVQLYGGVKNLLNWTPDRATPFLIARSNDPFDKNVQFDASGQPMVTAGNPYGLTFDANYAYAPNQGARVFFGLRYSFN